MKYLRQAMILDLIEKNSVETQEDLTELLKSNGFQVTQATVSRDIKELKLIKITDEKIYKREKIRNAFVHLRWFKGINDCYKLFDWGNGIDNELNYNWKANIKMNDMINCSEFYYKKALEQIEKQLSNLNKL